MIQAAFPSKSEEMKSVRLFKVSAIWRHPKAKRLVQKDFLISASSGEDAKDIAQQHLPTDMRLRNTPVNTVITNNLKLHIFDYGRPDNHVTYYESPLMECTIGRTDNQPVRTVLEPMVKKVQNAPTQPSAQPKPTASQTSSELKPETLPEQETNTAVPENTTTDTQTDTDTTDHSVQQPPEQKSEPTSKENPASEENPATAENTPKNPEPETDEIKNESPASESKESEDTEKSYESDASDASEESNESDESDETEETGDTTQNLIWLNSLFLTRFSYEMGRMQNLPDVPGIFLTKMQTIVKHPDFWTDLPNIVGNWVMEAYEKEMPDEQTALQFLQEKINAFIDNEGKQYLNQKEETPHEKETC